MKSPVDLADVDSRDPAELLSDREVQQCAKHASDVDVLVGNFGRSYSGINSTLERVVRYQSKSHSVAVIGGRTFLSDVPSVGLRAWRALWRKPSEKPFRIWHARRNNDMVIGLMLRDVLRCPLRIVFSSASQRHHTAFTRALISRMDAVIANSEASAAYLRRAATVIPIGIDPELFQPLSQKHPLRSVCGLPKGILVGCFGRIRSNKGTEIFVDAMINAMHCDERIHAVISGRTKRREKRFEQRIREKVRLAGLTDRFVWLGEVEPPAIPSLYRCLDIYVAPQTWEGYGVTPLEAMATALPVVATTVGAFPAIVEQDKTGILVAPGNAHAISEAVLKLSASEQLRQKLGSAGRARVAALFNVEDEAKRINAVYENLWLGQSAEEA